MANIRKRGNTYQITVSNGRRPDGTKIIESATFKPDPDKSARENQRDLQRFALDFEDRVLNGKYLDGEKITFADFTERWFSEHGEKQLAPTTVAHYRYQMNNKVLPELGRIKMARLTPSHIISLYGDLERQGVNPASIKKIHATMSSILHTAVDWQVIESNPCDRVRPPKIKRTNQGIKYFTPEQASVFLEALERPYVVTVKGHKRIDDTGLPYRVGDYTEFRRVPPQFVVFFNMALFGGFRRGELIALTWRDIDFEKCTVSITKAAAEVDHKIIIKEPKSAGSIRTVTLPDSVMQLIRNYKTEQRKTVLALGSKWENPGTSFDDNYLFTQWNGRIMCLSAPLQRFKDVIHRYNKSAKPEDQLPDIPLHGLRHTSATLLIGQNIDVRTVSGRLGHSQTSTTMNIYAHQLQKLDAKAADAIEDAIRSSKSAAK